MPVHLRPSAPTAPRAILCGDPARALTIAQELLEAPRMSNHHRGLWGYHGATPAGIELTVQATGIGGPSAAVVLGELAALGVEAAIRVGTCRGGPGSVLGSTFAIGSVRAGDGTSRALGVRPGAELPCDPELTDSLAAELGEPVGLASADLYPTPAAGEIADLQSAGLLAAGAELGLRVAVAVAIAANDSGPLEDAPLESALLRLAAAASNALELVGSEPARGSSVST
jgi:hypothetical protein